MPMAWQDGDPATQAATEASPYVFFDGRSNRRRLVTVMFGEQLEIVEASQTLATWPYADIRRADGPPGLLRLTCLSAPPLARLEIRDLARAAEMLPRCPRLDEGASRGVLKIVGWSLAAALSIVLVVIVGMPLVADRLAPLLPPVLERRIGEAAEVQIKAMFGDMVCGSPAGQAAFNKLVNQVQQAVGVENSLQTTVLDTPVPNALALPGGKVFMFRGLLDRAQDPDEIAGVLAHEFGHLLRHDPTRDLVYNGGSSFLIGLLFGDITGAGALIFASRSLVTASFSREAETGADTISIDAMRHLGRSPKPTGDLLFRVTGKEGDRSLSILANHPLTEDRLARMSAADQPASAPPLLSKEEWRALKAICEPNK